VYFIFQIVKVFNCLGGGEIEIIEEGIMIANTTRPARRQLLGFRPKYVGCRSLGYTSEDVRNAMIVDHAIEKEAAKKADSTAVDEQGKVAEQRAKKNKSSRA